MGFMSDSERPPKGFILKAGTPILIIQTGRKPVFFISPGIILADLPHLCCNRTYNSIYKSVVLKETTHLMKKILTFLKTIFKGIEEAQMARARAHLRFHNRGLFNHPWE